MMKRFQITVIALLLLFAASLFAAPRQLTSYQKLEKALKTGSEVRVVIHYGECELYIEDEKVENSPDATGGMTLQPFEWFSAGLFGENPAYVVASKSVLIENPQGEGYVFNYAKIRINEKGDVTLIARYLDPETYEIRMEETFKTVLNNKKNKGAAYFYAD